MNSNIRCSLMGLVLLVSVCLNLSAGTCTWKGGGDTPRWNDGTNWEGGVPPWTGDTVVIPNGKTAWASHFAGSSGDLDVLKAIDGIYLDGLDAVFELDAENDSVTETGCFPFSTPLSGNGHFVFKNTVNNDRYVRFSSDNSAFTGVYDFTNAMVKVTNAKAINPGCRINFSGCYGNHGVIFCPGIYSNDIHIVSALANNPYIGGTLVDGRPAVTNLGVVVVDPGSDKTSAYIKDGIHCSCVSNMPNVVSSLRIQGYVEIGERGIYGQARMMSGAALHLYGPNTGVNGYNPLGYVESGSASIHAHAANVLQAVYFKYQTVNLGGFDQEAVILSQLNTATLTTDRPAKLTWTGSNTTGNQTMLNVTLNGPVSIDYNIQNSAKIMTLDTVSGTMSGAFNVKQSNVVFGPNVNLPGLKMLASSGTKYFQSKVSAQTTNLNAGKLKLASSGDYGKIEVADGVQLDVLTFTVADEYVDAGVYGSAAAREAYPELVAEDHVLTCLAGTGTVKVRTNGPPGMIILVK